MTGGGLLVNRYMLIGGFCHLNKGEVFYIRISFSPARINLYSFTFNLPKPANCLEYNSSIPMPLASYVFRQAGES